MHRENDAEYFSGFVSPGTEPDLPFREGMHTAYVSEQRET